MLGFQQEQQAVVRQAIADAGEGEWTSLYVELVTLVLRVVSDLVVVG
jgi:hypothetical protein